MRSVLRIGIMSVVEFGLVLMLNVRALEMATNASVGCRMWNMECMLGERKIALTRFKDFLRILRILYRVRWNPRLALAVKAKGQKFDLDPHLAI
jgi:hypothetical protein